MTSNPSLGITGVTPLIEKQGTIRIDFQFEGMDYSFFPGRRLRELFDAGARIFELEELAEGSAPAEVVDVGYQTEMWGEFTTEEDRRDLRADLEKRLEMIMSQTDGLYGTIKRLKAHEQISTHELIGLLIDLVFERNFVNEPSYTPRTDTRSLVRKGPNQEGTFRRYSATVSNSVGTRLRMLQSKWNSR